MKSCLWCARTRRAHLGARRAARSCCSAASRVIAHLHADVATQSDWAFLVLYTAQRGVCLGMWSILSMPPGVYFHIFGRIWALLERFIRGCASLLHIFVPLASGFDITLLSRIPFLSAASSFRLHAGTHPRLYWFPLKLYLQKTGRM